MYYIIARYFEGESFMISLPMTSDEAKAEAQAIAKAAREYRDWQARPIDDVSDDEWIPSDEISLRDMGVIQLDGIDIVQVLRQIGKDIEV